MMKCIVFENPDGTISTRGGLGPCMLASFLTEVPTRGLGVKEALRRLAEAGPSEIEIARERALSFILETLVPRQNPDAINARIEDVQFPPDKHFRGAWKLAPGKIEVDMPKAREIHRDRLRQMRAEQLQEADARFFIALEAWLKTQPELPAALSAAISEKQALRDMTADPAIEAARTPEELKAAIPEALKA